MKLKSDSRPDDWTYIASNYVYLIDFDPLKI